jgi:hypothetical protein
MASSERSFGVRCRGAADTDLPEPRGICGPRDLRDDRRGLGGHPGTVPHRNRRLERWSGRREGGRARVESFIALTFVSPALRGGWAGTGRRP